MTPPAPLRSPLSPRVASMAAAGCSFFLALTLSACSSTPREPAPLDSATPVKVTPTVTTPSSTPTMPAQPVKVARGSSAVPEATLAQLKALDGACARGQAAACLQAGDLYVDGDDEGFESDPRAGVERLRKACDLGLQEGCSHLEMACEEMENHSACGRH